MADQPPGSATGSRAGSGTNSPVPEGGRPATESLLHTQRIAEGFFDLSRGVGAAAGAGSPGDSPFERFRTGVERVGGRHPDAFDVLANVFDFQHSSVANQRDNAISMLASRLSRAVGRELKNLVSLPDAGMVLEAFHGELLSNYTRWCSFLGVNPVSLRALFADNDTADEFALATESALMLLIWGEAGNLRFCPEFLCFLFHKMAAAFRTAVEGLTPDITVPKYLDEVITPAYDILAQQLASVGHGVIDHSSVCNYDDFNEIFWQEECLKFTIATMFEGKLLKRKFQKTFVERQSWLVPIFSFWRVHTLHIVGLHVMIVGAKCQEDIGSCDDRQWGSAVITLYACSVIRDLWDIKQALFVFAGHRGPFGQLALNILRGGIKAAMTFLLLVLFWGDNDAAFVGTAVVFFLMAVFIEAIMLTEFWWGISSYGKWGASTDRSCAGGGFAACVPSRIRQLGWSFVGSLCGINSVNLYTTVHSLPPMRKRLRYICFWGIVLLTKISFSYLVVIRKMAIATQTLYDAESTDYDFGALGTLTDSHNFLYIAALWLGSGLIYFLDMQIWFVVWANIAAAVEGVRRRVGELNGSDEVVRAFSHLHKEFFNYLKRDMKSTTMHARFAHVWNEIVDAMRDEDILSNRERLQLRYFLINLRLPKADPNARNANFAPEATEGEWGPLFTLLPEFLMSGAIQRAVQSSADFAKSIGEDLAAIKREEGLASMHQSANMARASGVSVSDRHARVGYLRGLLAQRQAKFLLSNGNDQVTTEMVRQLSATTFILIDALCRNDGLSRSLWNLHRSLFASDVNQAGKGIGKSESWIAALYDFGDRKDKPPVKVVGAFSKKTLLFSIQNFPGFIAAMVDLVKALNKHVTTPNWNQTVANKLDKMVVALLSLLDTKFESAPDSKAAGAFLLLLTHIRTNLGSWRTSFAEAGGGAAPGARQLKSTAKEFLRRTLVFLEAPGNSQPGLIKGAEARRRITFFVNSLFVEQPKPKRVLTMPSLTTLTPYYNEDVVLSIESLREETQDGVTVLEYLRSIYPDEFDNFVERMRVMSASKAKHFPFDVDVMDPMLGVVLDTDIGGDLGSDILSRDGVLKKVKRAIVSAVQKKRADDGQSVLDPEEIEKATNTIDVDDMMLQMQMWASNRGQTLSRTVRGIMYYSQAVRLLAVVENIEEYQPEETGYMFGSSDKPDERDGLAGAANEITDAVQTLMQNKKHKRSKSGVGGGEQSSSNETAFRLRFWQQRQQPTVSGEGAAGSGGLKSQGSFRNFFHRNKRDDLEATLDADLAQLDVEEGEGGDRILSRPPRPPPRPSPVHPSPDEGGLVAGRGRGGAGGAGSHPATGGKLKEAVQRALKASRREKALAERRGRQKIREEGDTGNFQGFIQVKDPALDKACVEYGFTEELAEAKYRYVVSCQVFAKMETSKKKADRDKAAHIKMLARMYPGLRIAYVEEKDGSFFSVLSKHSGTGDLMEEEYRVRLPGQILVGEGKPNNQNHAIIFTRGEAIQAIDMNQDAALEDAIKIRQVMEEFNFAEGGTGRGRNIGRIVGFREHVFTHDVSAVANFFSLQELNFVSATQRALDNPLHVRFHYGHPDVFDRMSAITLGGVSKACKGIHLSEDIFAGFNYVLRGGESTQADYIQVAKGRDTGVSQVTGFTAKISMGNGMQARSREVGRLASQFDLFRLLSFYYSSVGGFMNQVLLMTAVFLYVYAKLYIVFDPDFTDTVDDEVLDAISSQFLFQLGFLLILPIPLLLAVEQGVQRAVSTTFNILLRMAPFFFIFSAGTNAYYVNSAVMTGQAKYQATGRGFVIAHESFGDMFPLYLTSHFNVGFELLVVLIVYGSFATSGYFLETFSVYLLIIGLLWTPLVFNPNGLDFTYASQDFTGWLQWMNSPVDDPKKGWLSWYSRVLEETRHDLPFGKKIQAILRRSRLLILVYGFLTAIGEDYPGGITGGTWPGSAFVGTILLIVVGLLMCQSWIRAKCCPPKPLKYGVQKARWARLWKLFILVAVIVGIIVFVVVDILESFQQLIFYILAFFVLVYYVAQIVVLFVEDSLRNVALVNLAFKSVHFITGLVIMLPILVLSFFPLFVDLQTRMLFNEDFSQRFSIAKIFARQSNRRAVKKTN